MGPRPEVGPEMGLGEGCGCSHSRDRGQRLERSWEGRSGAGRGWEGLGGEGDAQAVVAGLQLLL